MSVGGLVRGGEGDSSRAAVSEGGVGRGRPWGLALATIVSPRSAPIVSILISWEKPGGRSPSSSEARLVTALAARREEVPSAIFGAPYGSGYRDYSHSTSQLT